MSVLEGLEEALQGLDTSLSPDVMRQAAKVLESELIVQARKNLSRRVGMMGKQVGKDVASTQLRRFLDTLRVEVEGNEFVVEWEDPREGAKKAGATVEGAPWVHPSVEKGGYVQRAIDIALPRIADLIADDIAKRFSR